MKQLKRFSKKFKGFQIIILAALIGVFSINATVSDFEISKNLDIFSTLFRELNQNYVDEIQPGDLMKTAIDKMLETLDPYTVFIPESEIEDYRFMTTGQYGGIGSLIQKQGDKIVITEPYEGFPAQLQGLKAGDVLLEINGESVAGKSTSDVSDLLKGQPGTEVKLLIERPGEANPIALNITRAEIKVDNISYFNIVDNDIAYIKLDGFTYNAGSDVRNAYIEMKNKNPELKGVVLDLRGNGGGLLNEAVNVANVFVDKGTIIVNTKGKLKDSNKTYRTLNPATDVNIPLAVLVDGGSASASEIVAGAIQDLDRGVIIGQKSYGKGLVQNIVSLSYNTKLKVTIAKYYIPSGRCIQAIDYSHRVNGKASGVNDSLKSAFKTRNGRVVFDGGGIIPDVEIKPDSLAKITISLILKHHIFNYATIYVREHSSIAQPEVFMLNGVDYQAFVHYLDDKEYDYTTDSESMLKRLIQAAKDERYYEIAKAEFDALESRIKHNKSEDLNIFKDEIIQFLSNEIVSRYYYQKGRIRHSLQTDKELKEAISILRNSTRYNQILSASK